MAKPCDVSRPGAPGPHTSVGQTILALQGGGALGAYQVGVYEAMHEAGMEPDWVVGTSIGAINGAIIAGNHPKKRMGRLHEFWDRMELDRRNSLSAFMSMFGNALTNMTTVISGVPGFFAPNPQALFGLHARLGVDRAAYYTTDLLRETLNHLIDPHYLQSKKTRLTVGAVNANSGAMRYFDGRQDALTVDYIMASCALPPAFPAVRIDGEPSGPRPGGVR